MKIFLSRIHQSKAAFGALTALLLAPSALAHRIPCGLAGEMCCPSSIPGGEPSCDLRSPWQCTDGICEECANVYEPVCNNKLYKCAPELEPDSAGICICPRDFGDVPCVSDTCRPGLEVGPDGLCTGIGGCGQVGAACCDTEPGFECDKSRSSLRQCGNGICEKCANVFEPACRDTPFLCAPELEPDSAGICICPRDFGDVPCVSDTCRPGLEVGPDGLCTGVGGCGEEGAACCDTEPGLECRNLIGTSVDGRDASRPLQCNRAGVCEACGKAGLAPCADNSGAPKATCEGRFAIVSGVCQLCGAVGEPACPPPWRVCDAGLVEEAGRCVTEHTQPCGERLQDCCAGSVCHGGLKCFTRFSTRPRGLCVSNFRSRAL